MLNKIYYFLFGNPTPIHPLVIGDNIKPLLGRQSAYEGMRGVVNYISGKSFGIFTGHCHLICPEVGPYGRKRPTQYYILQNDGLVYRNF